MSRRYHRVESAFWTDPAVSSWGDDARLLALYVQTCPHRTTEGLFRLPKAYIADDLKWSPQRLAAPFAELLRDGFLEYHEPTSTLLIVGALRVQAPDNKNQVTAAVKAISELAQSPLISRFYALSERFSERLAKGLREGLPERLGDPPTPSPSQTPSPTPPPFRANEEGEEEEEIEFNPDDLPRPGSDRR